MTTTGGEMKNKDLKADGKGNNKEVDRRILHQVSTEKCGKKRRWKNSPMLWKE
jgi:hypothetical protein